MTNNFLHPEYLPDIAEALVDRTGAKLPDSLRASVIRKLIEHFYESPEASVPVRTLPLSAPIWTRGKALTHLAPTTNFIRELFVLAEALATVYRLVTSGRLTHRHSQMQADFTSLIKGFAHYSWEEAVSHCVRQRFSARSWEKAQTEVFAAAIVPSLHGRRWRRLRSVQDVWDVCNGTQWCLRKDFYNGRLLTMTPESGPELWILEDGASPVALLRVALATRLIEEVEGPNREVPFQYRADIQELIYASRAKAPDGSVTWGSTALALDADLGRSGQAYRSGRLVGGRARRPIYFRLWADGRRGRYLVGFSTSESDEPELYLRLDVKHMLKSGIWGLTGAKPQDWRGRAYNLMRRVLTTAYPAEPRAAHICIALKRSNLEAQIPANPYIL